MLLLIFVQICSSHAARIHPARIHRNSTVDKSEAGSLIVWAASATIMPADLLTEKDLHPELYAGDLLPWPAEKISTELGPVSQPMVVMGPDGDLIVNSSRVGNNAARQCYNWHVLQLSATGVI